MCKLSYGQNFQLAHTKDDLKNNNAYKPSYCLHLSILEIM